MELDRRQLLGLSAVALALGAAACDTSQSSSGGGQRRSILLVIADDHGYDLSCAGGAVKTPVLDKLAGEGTFFTEGYATVSSCSSSRSTMFTGLYSHTNGMYGLSHDVHNFSLLEDVKTISDMVKQAGFATALVGKKHVKPMVFDAELAPEETGNRDVARLAHAAGGWLREQAGKPFLLIVGFSDPHRAPGGFGNTQDWPEVPTVRYTPSDVQIPSHLPDLPDVRKDLADYYQSVSRMDAGVGLVLDELKAAGRADDTLVVYISDNGRPFPGAKDALYTEGVHLPLIVRAPGRDKQGQGKPGTRNRAMVSWIDIAPTLLDWAGVRPPEGYKHKLPGRSLLPILDEEDPAGWDRVFATHSFHEINQYYPMRSVRTRQYSYYRNLEPRLSFDIASDMAEGASWKAISSTPGAKLGERSVESFLRRPAEELYDLRVDPLELVNLVERPDHADALSDLRMQLDMWRKETHDPWMQGVTDPFGHAH